MTADLLVHWHTIIWILLSYSIDQTSLKLFQKWESCNKWKVLNLS